METICQGLLDIYNNDPDELKEIGELLAEVESRPHVVPGKLT
jgi:hypothetical protein